jgi:drug/metabolite transporter (DMT)-like permease
MSQSARRTDLIALVVAVAAVSLSGPIMTATDAPALGIAFWRNALGAAVTLPFVFRHRETLRRLARGQWLAMASAGVLLGLHFATWIPSLRYTSIAASTALVATQVVWAAILAFLAGHRAPRAEWIGIGIALLGVVLLTGIDISLSPRALIGDVLALLGAMASAAYMTVGQRVRPALPLAAYTAVVYATSAITLDIICLVGSVPLSGYSLHAWLLIAAVTAVAQFGGHSLLNMALRSFSATAVSIAILFEMPGSTLVGWVWPGQTPPWALLPAALLIVGGIVLVLRASRPTTVDVDAVTP